MDQLYLFATEIDKLMQMRAELVMLTRPMRQFGNGLIVKSEKIRSRAAAKIDLLAPTILTDWNDPESWADAAERQESRERRRLRKIEKSQVK